MRLHQGLRYEADKGGAGAGSGVAGTQADTGAAGAGTGAGAASGVAGNGSGSGAFDWKGLNLSPELQTVVEKHQWANPGAVVESYANLHKLTSLPPDRLLKIPTDKDSPEMWKEFRTKLGVPETPEGYKLPVPQGDKGEFATIAAKWMHEAGIPSGAAVKLADAWNKHVAEQQTAATSAMEAKHAAQVTELKGEWGVDYDKNAEIVDRAAAEFGMSQEHLNALKTVMGPKGAMEFLYNIGIKVGGEGPFVSNDKGGGTNFDNLSPAQAAAEVARLKADPSFRQMFNSKDPNTRSEARMRMDRLTRLAAPGVTVVAGPNR